MARENLFSVVVGETVDGRGKVNATRGASGSKLSLM